MTSLKRHFPKIYRIFNTLQKPYVFITQDIWRIPTEKLSPVKAFIIHQIRAVLMTIKGFRNDNCIQRASALTFFTVLSLVPILAMTLGIAKGFGFEKLLENELIERFSAQQEMITDIIGYAKGVLEENRGGLIALGGIGFLLWAIIKVLSHIEHSFNHIWRVQNNRTWNRKFTDYLTFMLICPAMVVSHGTLSVYLNIKVRVLTENVAFLGYFSPLIYSMLKLLPYGLIWMLFSFLYIMMPNTKVNPFIGILSGVIAGTVYQFAQWAYITFQIGVARYNAIYGSFAAIPLFMIWMHISWLIVLFGAELCHAVQNADHFEFEPDIRCLSYHRKKVFYIAAAQALIRQFSEAKPALTVTDLSKMIGIPFLLARSILDDMRLAGLAVVVQGDKNSKPAYQPSKAISGYTVGSVLNAIEQIGDATFTITDSELPELKKLSSTLVHLHEAIEQTETYQKRLEEI
jgi:membrane protein